MAFAPSKARGVGPAGATTQAKAYLRVARYGSMDKLLFWLGIGAAQKGAGSKPTASLHPVVAFVVGILLALLIAVGAFMLLISQQRGPLARTTSCASRCSRNWADCRALGSGS